jgi:hypothetical protein
MNLHMLVLVGLVVVSLLVGAIGALHSVAPHTETKVDDQLDEYGQKALPWLVKVLAYFQARL